MKPRGVHIALVAMSTLVGLGIIEAALRVRATLNARGTLDHDRALPPDPLPGTRARLGEMIRRSSNPRIIYELRPNLDVVYEGGRVTTSARGFRGQDPGPEKATGVIRIVGVGDSFMYGHGVDDDQTHLARHLGERAGTIRYDAVNLAVPGYNAAMEVEAFKDKGVLERG